MIRNACGRTWRANPGSPGQPWFVNWSMVISLVSLGILAAADTHEVDMKSSAGALIVRRMTV